jgi:hypothetical protein
VSAYHSKTEEEHPVFHVWTNCSEGEKIEEKNKVVVLQGRSLCEVCANMVSKKKS